MGHKQFFFRIDKNGLFSKLSTKVVFTFLIGYLSIFILSAEDISAIQQTASKIDFRLELGQSDTQQWGFVSDSDEPAVIKIHAEGAGSELLSFPESIRLEPRQFLQFDITASIPENHQNDVIYTPTVYAMLAGETGGAATINIVMKKPVTIRIGNPVETAVVEAKPSEKQDAPDMDLEIQPKEQKDVKAPQPLILKEEEIDPEPEVDPEPQADPSFAQAQAQMGEETDSGGCLIATAAYGSEIAPQVQLLREVRDNVLLSTSSGAGFMTVFNSVYYSFSPTVADWERDSPTFKAMVQVILTPMLSTLSILNAVEINSESEMLGYGIGIILLNVGMYLAIPAVILHRISKSKWIKRN